MATILTRLTHNIAIQLHLVADCCTISSSRSKAASPETFGCTLVFGTKREELAGGWRRLHNELYNLYSSPNIIRVIKLG